jgi:hypothetical protein
MRYAIQGKMYDRDDLEDVLGRLRGKAPVLVTGTGLPHRNTSYVFLDEKSCIAWASKLDIAPTLKTYYAKLKQARALQTNRVESIMELQRRKLRRTEANLKDLASYVGLPLHSKELFLRATVSGSILEGPVGDPARVYRNVGFAGANAFIVTPVPILSLLSPSLNNSISSIRVVGTCGLFNGTWWSGASVLFVGIPYTEEPNLALVVPPFGPFANFNNLASSIMVGPVT